MSLSYALETQEIEKRIGYVSLNPEAFVSYKDGKGHEIFGMIIKVFSNPKVANILPFFGYNTKDNTFEIFNGSVQRIPVEKINLNRGLSQMEGLDVWKEMMSQRGMDPKAQVQLKIQALTSEDIQGQIENNRFSLKQALDGAFDNVSRFLKTGIRDVSFEDLYAAILQSIAQSPALLKRSKVLRDRVKEKLDNTEISIKAKLVEISREFAAERQLDKSHNKAFLETLCSKYQSDIISKEDVLNLISDFERQDGTISELLSGIRALYQQKLKAHQQRNLTVKTKRVFTKPTAQRL